MTFNYNLVITGSIGVGKSTICTLLNEVLVKELDIKESSIRVYNEFINTPVGRELFRLRLKNEVSPLTLQSYILDVWDSLLDSNGYCKHDSFNIFERLPYDSVMIFAKDSLTDTEFDAVRSRYKDIVKKYDLIEYDSPLMLTSVVDNSGSLSSTIKNIIDIINTDLEHNVTNSRTIHLVTSNEVVVKRVHKRGTNEDLNSIIRCNTTYNSLIG